MHLRRVEALTFANMLVAGGSNKKAGNEAQCCKILNSEAVLRRALTVPMLL